MNIKYLALFSSANMESRRKILHLLIFLKMSVSKKPYNSNYL